MLAAGARHRSSRARDRVGAGFEQDLLQVGTPDESRRSERPAHARDVARRQRVRVGASLEQETHGLFAAAEDRQVKRL